MCRKICISEGFRILILTGFLISFLIQDSTAQIYNYSYNKDKKTLYSSIGGLALIYTYDRLRPLKRVEEVSSLDASALIGIERKAIGQSSQNFRTFSDVFLFSSLASPLLLRRTCMKSKENHLGISLMALQGFLWQVSLNSAVKALVHRPRPFAYEWPDPTSVDQTKNDTGSFYSGHTATAAYFTFFVAKVYGDLNPTSKWKPFIWAGSALLPAAMAYSRFKAGRHFPSDVAVGYIVGAGLGLLTPEIYKSDDIDVSLSITGLRCTFSLN